MKNCRMNVQMFVMVLLSLILMGAAGGEVSYDERPSLEEQTSALRKRLASLERERDFLLFQKAMYSTDSKYLIMNFTRRTGQLKYKNRVLMDFRFKTSGKYPGRGPQPGMVVLSKKKEGKNDQHTLAFGGSFIMHWKRSDVPTKEAGMQAISLPKKDMLSIYYAMEEGALAYVIH